ncbi:hypothetical protein Tco_1168732 [Tanacetum coccineum]
MALPEDHLAKFHKMTDAKEMWEAIKSRFSGNDESKKMQKYILKQQFEGFSVSNSEGLHKGYDRTKPGVDSLSFDDLYNNLRVFENDVKGSAASSSSTQNVAFVSENTSSTNDVSTAYGVSNPSGHNSQYEQTTSYSLLANQSSCPQLDHEDLEQLDEFDLEEMDLKWQVAMISMRMKKLYKKTGVDSLSFDDLYNNLRVFKNDVKGSAASSSSTQNVAFVSENTSSTNDVSTAYGVSYPSGHNSQYEQTTSYSLLANQSNCPQFDHEDLEQLDEFDLEEIDLKWQVAMISMRMKKLYKKTGLFARECITKGNQDSKWRDAWNSGNKDGRRSGKKEDSKALVTIDGEGVAWTSHSEEEKDYAVMAYSCSGSNTKVTSCSKECKESYAKIKKLYDAQREQLGDASIEIQAYTQALKKVEAQLLLINKVNFAEKVREDLKAKVEKWHNSSKNLGKLLNTQMSANDKIGLGYGDYRYDGILSYENEVLQSVFMNKESDLENQPLYGRFVTAEGIHVVPPPMTGNYMPSGPDIEIDYSQFTYGPKQSQISE